MFQEIPPKKEDYFSEHEGMLLTRNGEPNGRVNPGGKISAQEVPDREIPDRDVPDREIPDREIPDREIPQRGASNLVRPN